MKTVQTILLGLLLGLAGQATAIDPRGYIEKAVELIAQAETSLARSYLDPALIAPGIRAGERSLVYYLRGFSFGIDNMPVSARKDFNRALEFNPGNPAALVELGRLYAAGRGIDKDTAVAFGLFEQAAQLDYAPGLFHMGYAYLQGDGIEKNLLKAREILMQAADAGHTFAMMSLAASYRSEHVASPEPEVAREWYEKAHAAGDAKALLSIGYMYARGEFGQPDAVTAFDYFRQAAQAGVSAAHVSVGYAYLTGNGVAQDADAAFAAYQTAADAGEIGAYLGLGHLYETGQGVTADMQQARSWYEKGARLGHVDAQLRLMAVYLQEPGEAARRRAAHWARAAAGSGHAQARNDYAWMLATSKFDSMRNGTLALNHAEKAVQTDASAVYLDTLAAAYAEVGNFEQAVATQQQALAALKEEDAALKGELETRLQYYRRSEPWRE